MTAALEQVFTSATNEDARRAQQSAALDKVLTGPAAEIIALMKNIGTAAEQQRKSFPLLRRLSDDAMAFYIKSAEFYPHRNDNDDGVEKTFRLNQGQYGRGVAITFRNDGTMKIAQENKHYVLTTDPVRYYGARLVTDSNEVFDDNIDPAEARKQIGVFLALAMEETPRQKLQAAVANITPATGAPSPRPS